MVLAIDIGNTHTVIGIFEEGAFRGHWRFFSDHTRTADECALLLHQISLWSGVALEEITGIVMASVVPPLTPVFEEMVQRYLNQKPILVSSDLEVSVAIGCAEPKRVGADRIANAVGAFEKFGGPTIVVDLGTATTFDVITRDGVYLGGAIAPGVETSATMLFHKTAQLPRVELAKPETVIGRTTEDSLQAGIFYGTVGQIDEIVRRIEMELEEKATVVATGGLAELVSQEARTIEVVEPYLTLEGLYCIFKRLQGR
ncbi:MAG: type III pantothenate kinase [Gemmatimonadota bacterium]|nr:MAG: type III pantothenate kinase [Gemmatimonadota bacterium]